MILVVSSFMFFPNNSSAQSSSEEILDVGFGGSFSTETGYTNSTGEIMDGSLSRRTGDEKIEEGSVYLKGNKDGIDYKPRISLGSDTVDKALVVETEFRPDSNQESFNTLLSIGGNIYVRYTSDSTLEYGFDVNKNGKWNTVKQSVDAPTADESHSIALVYKPTDKGANMSLYLDGKELPSLTSKEGKPNFANTEQMIGFGNEVHPQGLERGLQGSISTVIVTNFNGAFNPSLLKTMDLTSVDQKLLIRGGGKLEGSTYSPSEDEVVSGTLKIDGGEKTGLGRINMRGDGSVIKYTPDNIQGDNVLSENYVTEILAESSVVKPGTVFMDILGAVTVRGAADSQSLEVLVGNQVKDTIDISQELNNDYLHLSVVYKDIGNDEASVNIWVGEKQIGETITLSTLPKTDRNSIVFAGAAGDDAGNSLAGEVYGVAFSTLEGNFSADVLGLLGGPCTIPTDVEPGYQINIEPNECPEALAKKASLVRPKPKQVTWQQYEQTAFIHYGINTYYGVEWGGFNLDPNKFQPTDLDTDQWARTLKESGFKMAVITVKHHDGFALYPSRYTDFDVASSSWRDGKGDVLREFVDSMRKYGLKVGVYLSPADHNAYSEGIYANGSSQSTRTIPTLVEDDDRKGDNSLSTFELPATDYGEMFLNQLYEVLTEYGPIDEVWFDGAQGNIPGDAVEKYDWDSYYKLINSLQPQAVVAVTGNDVRWVGNESGFARENEWSVLGATTGANGRQSYYPSFKSPDLGSRSALSDAAANGMDYLTWWPAEVDVSIRPGWFYHDNQQPKSLNKLRDIYYNSVARNSVLLLNVPPNKEGKFAQQDVDRLKEWHQSIKRDFAINHASDAKITARNGAKGSNPDLVSDEDYDTSWQAGTESNSITFYFGKEAKVNRVVLQEDINQGQQVESFAIDVLQSNGDWEEVYTNKVIGYKRIATLSEEITGKKFRVRILKSRGPVHLAEIGFYQTLPESEVLPPILEVKNKTISVGEKLDLKSLISVAEDIESNDLTEEVVIDKGDFDPTKPGAYEITYTLKVDGAKKVVKTVTVRVERPAISNADNLKKQLEQFEVDGELDNKGAARLLKIHLNAISHFEKKDEAKKVLKHLEGFESLLHHYKKKEFISEHAFNVLKAGTDTLIAKWQ